MLTACAFSGTSLLTTRGHELLESTQCEHQLSGPLTQLWCCHNSCALPGLGWTLRILPCDVLAVVGIFSTSYMNNVKLQSVHSIVYMGKWAEASFALAALFMLAWSRRIGQDKVSKTASHKITLDILISPIELKIDLIFTNPHLEVPGTRNNDMLPSPCILHPPSWRGPLNLPIGVELPFVGFTSLLADYGRLGSDVSEELKHATLNLNPPLPVNCLLWVSRNGSPSCKRIGLLWVLVLVYPDFCNP